MKIVSLSSNSFGALHRRLERVVACKYLHSLVRVGNNRSQQVVAVAQVNNRFHDGKCHDIMYPSLTFGTTLRPVTTIAKSSAIAEMDTSKLSRNTTTTTTTTPNQFSTKTKGNKGKNKNDNNNDDELSYFERKKQLKATKIKQYEEKVERIERVKDRRLKSYKNTKKDNFQSWFLTRKVNEERMDREARKANMEWKINVAVILERIPIIMPDKENWEIEYDELYAYLNWYGKEYPKEFIGEEHDDDSENSKSEPIISDDDVLANLPEGFELAPRITEADISGNVHTMDRKLKTRIYLTIQEKEDSYWKLPTSTVKLNKNETLLDAAKRTIKEQIGNRINLYCSSNCPVAVDLNKYSVDKQTKEGYYGMKTFYMKVQYDDGGKINKKDILSSCNDYAWLDRDEIVERVGKEQGEEQSKFYHYVL